MLIIYCQICLPSGHSEGTWIDLLLFGLILMLQYLQSIVPKDLIKVLDDGNPTILPAWDPMVCFLLLQRSIDCVADFWLHRAHSRNR